MNSTVYIYVNSIACYGPRYICKCKRHDNVRYECITNGLFGTLATERICSAVLLNCTKARIEPLFELNRTAASVASSNNGMPTFSTPSTQKKNSCRMLEGEKNNLQAHTRKIYCCDTEFCFFFNIQPEPITNYKNRKINTRFATNTCCVKIGNRRRGGYTESDNRLKQTLYGKALQSHED